MGVKEQVRALMEVASGLAEVPKQQAERIAKGLMEQTEGRGGSVTALAQEIVKRSKQNAEMARTLVVGEIKRQIKSMGLASSEDVERLARRIRNLEKSASGAKKKAPARKSST